MLVDTSLLSDTFGALTVLVGSGNGRQAAASGGVCTVVDMPLNAIPPTTTVANLHEKIEASRGKCRVDVAFWGGVISGNEVSGRPVDMQSA